MRAVFSLFRLRSQAAIVPLRDALCVAFSGKTFVTRNTPSRRPGMASPTSSSERPSPYISAVSMSVAPASRPRRSVAISSARSARWSPMFQAPRPKAGTCSPEGSATVFIASLLSFHELEREAVALAYGGVLRAVLVLQPVGRRQRPDAFGMVLRVLGIGVNFGSAGQLEARFLNQLDRVILAHVARFHLRFL